MTYVPKDDGVTHINIYSKGATELGRALTHFSTQFPYIDPEWGPTYTLEGLWHFLATGCVHRELLKMPPVLVKQRAKTLTKVQRPTFQKDISRAQLGRIIQHKELELLLMNSSLPFTHYYYYGEMDNPKVIDLPQYKWIVENFEGFRSLLQTW